MGWMKQLAIFAQDEGLPTDMPLEELYDLYMAARQSEAEFEPED